MSSSSHNLSTTIPFFLELPDPEQELSVQTHLNLRLFHCFSRLPPELRMMIWKEAIAREPIHFTFLGYIDGSQGLRHFISPPITHAINNESRQEMLRTHQLFPQTYYDTSRPRKLGHEYGYGIVKREIYIRPDVDVLHMDIGPFALELLRDYGKTPPSSPYVVSVDWPNIFRKIQRLEIDGWMLPVSQHAMLAALRVGTFQLFDSLKDILIHKVECISFSPIRDPRIIDARYKELALAMEAYFEERNSGTHGVVKRPAVRVRLPILHV